MAISLVLLLDPQLNDAAKDFVAAWAADERSRAMGVASVTDSESKSDYGPGADLAQVAVDFSVGIGASGAFEMIKLLLRKVRPGTQVLVVDEDTTDDDGRLQVTVRVVE
ncbi:hypothetical protein [Streptomyces sp. ODS28]|uniref:hypothetical protein n=1 Tax=Streptomyces sp. ODS28 TaxID=3136688 RepID=UPI0031E6E332